MADATLRANILAIMSFTLNRVFTEWYRNKGYDFTITSSTAVGIAGYAREILASCDCIWRTLSPLDPIVKSTLGHEAGMPEISSASFTYISAICSIVEVNESLFGKK